MVACSNIEDAMSRCLDKVGRQELRRALSASYVRIVQDTKRDTGRQSADCDFAFRCIVDLYWRFVLEICRRMLPDLKVEDLMQDVFLAVWKGVSGCDAERFPGWIAIIAENTCRDHQRKMKRSIPEVLSLNSVSELRSNWSPQSTEPDERDFFENGVKPHLSALDYELVWLHYKLGWKLTEIAEVTGETEGEIANRHRQIKKDLGDEFGYY